MSWLRSLFEKNPTEKDLKGNLETEQEYKERWTSIRIIYFTMFMMSLGFSIILTGVWPYLDKVDTRHILLNLDFMRFH